MVGGGQLGRMFAAAATRMGYEVVVLCEDPAAPAAQVTNRRVIGALDDQKVVAEFAAQCDVISLEFENIPADSIALCSEHAPTYPAASVLATAQDRLREKTTLGQAGLPVVPVAEVRDAASVEKVAESIGWPLVVKTIRSGYDGKGQHRLESPADSNSVDWASGQGWIAEPFVDFEREVSVIVARTPDGRCETFPLLENRHEHHILDVSIVPAAASETLQVRAREIAVEAAQALDLVGLLCVEMFARGDDVMINEVAPRPHNSGHLTIEACETSQFEQHVRAICNLPLGSTGLVCGAAAMSNLLGDLWATDGQPPAWDRALEVPGIRLHLYGKSAAKPRRKMGHLTATGDDPEEVAERVRRARESLTSA